MSPMHSTLVCEPPILSCHPGRASAAERQGARFVGGAGREGDTAIKHYAAESTLQRDVTALAHDLLINNVWQSTTRSTRWRTFTTECARSLHRWTIYAMKQQI